MAERGNAAELQKDVRETKRKTSKEEAIYSADEFAKNSKALFGTSRECVVAAFRNAGISKCSVPKAKETVRAFLRTEVI